MDAVVTFKATPRELDTIRLALEDLMTASGDRAKKRRESLDARSRVRELSDAKALRERL